MILYSLLVALLSAAVVEPYLSRKLDAAERWGVAGVLGLGMAGLVQWILAVAMGPATLVLLGLVPIAIASFGFLKNRPDFTSLKVGGLSPSLKLAVLVSGLVGLLGLVTVFAPATMTEWDTLAYHFAVPKLWLQHKDVAVIPFIHHSHFPYVVDSLFLNGLADKSESAARFFTWAYWAFGAMAIFGMARRKGGESAGIWSLIGYLGIPVLLWEAGTGYVDGAHGLFVALGALYAMEWCAGESVEHPWVAGALLGFAAGSKYTGLLSVFIAVGALVLFGLRSKRGLSAAFWVLGIGVLIPMPWLVRNAQATGNPVFPFFYSKLGGKGWDAWRAEIYENEQKTFGLGREGKGRDATYLGASVLGLGYGPGRFTNPNPVAGTGFPIQGIGAAGLLGGLAAWVALGRRNRWVVLSLTFVAINLLAWFFLSQQSRYVSGLAIILVVSLGVFAASALGMIGRIAAALQLAVAGYGHYSAVTQDQLPVVLGKISREDYLAQRVPLAGFASDISTRVGAGKVALYDEVFGSLLDCDYIWANPGHSMIIDHEGANTGEEFAASLKKVGITHVFVNFRYSDKAFSEKWQASFSGTSAFSADEEKAMMGNLDLKWKLLIARAVSSGQLVGVQGYPGSVLFEVK